MRFSYLSHQKAAKQQIGQKIQPVIPTPFNSFANRADPDQAALEWAAWSESTLFAYGNMIKYDPTLVLLTNKFLYSMYKPGSVFI